MNIAPAAGKPEVEALAGGHRIDIQLPDTIPAGKAKIAIIYEMADAQPPQNTRMLEFLGSLPDQPEEGLSRDEIRAFIDRERSGWDD